MSAWEDAVGELRAYVAAQVRVLREYRKPGADTAEWNIASSMADAARTRLDHAALRAAVEVSEGREPQP